MGLGVYFWPPNQAFSLKIFLAETAGPNALKIIWCLLEHVIMLSFAPHGDCSSVRRVQGRPLFGNGRKIVLRPKIPGWFELNLVWNIRVTRPCPTVLPIWIHPCKAAGDDDSPKFGIIWENLLVTRYQAECVEFNIGLLKHVQMLIFVGHGSREFHLEQGKTSSTS